MLNDYPTIADAASEFGVSAKTVREWVRKGIIPEPGTIQIGTREVWHFPDGYMAKAKKALDAHVRKKNKNKNKKK